jgi:hypothetical protein
MRLYSNTNERNTYTATPNNAPIPAVINIASTPQNVTRKTAFNIGEPPIFEEKIPSNAKQNNDVKDTAGIKIVAGNINTANNGIAAPTAKVAAEENAA